VSETKALAYRVFSSSIARQISNGVRKILITSSGPGEGKSTITARLGESLARSDRLRVAIVDADAFRPTLHKFFQLDYRRGLGELLGDICDVDLNGDNSKQFGIGDWIELIRAQARTGRFQVSEGSEEFSIIFNKGRVSSVPDRQGQRDFALRAQEEGGRPLGEAELDAATQLELNKRLRRMLALPKPQYRFLAAPQAQSDTGSRPPTLSSATGIDRLILGMVGDELNQPYLSRQVSAYLKNTSMPNLKILTCGERATDLYLAEPFVTVVDRLAKCFDAVLIDAAPVAFDTSTSLLAPTIDGVLLVVKADGFDVGVIQRAKDQLQRSGANLLGVALNQVDLPREAAFPYYQGSSREPA
jgi:Mrp family chromosome partitioning ATPase